MAAFLAVPATLGLAAPAAADTDPAPPFIDHVQWAHWGDLSSLRIYPTASGRAAAAQLLKPPAEIDEAWGEVLALAPDADTPGMRQQFVCHFRFAEIAEPGKTKTSAVTVETPDGAMLSLHDPLLKTHLEQAAGEPASLIQVARGVYDAMPVSIQTTAGHAALEAAHGCSLDIARFRINVIVESELAAVAWQGHRLAFGNEEDGAVVQCADPIARCVIVTIDPATGAKEPRVLRTVAQGFGNAYGIYAGPARPGLIRVGDPVRLVD